MPEVTYEDVRRRLFEAAWDVPTYAPAPERAVPRARRRAATTIGGGVLAAVLAIVVGASSFPIDSGETSGIQPTDVDDREFLVDISTGETTEISNVSAMKGAAGFDVSPDGRQIVFGEASAGESRLFVADLDGSALRPLTRGFLDVDDPAWSPNGREIAFTGLRVGETVRSLLRGERRERASEEALANFDGRTNAGVVARRPVHPLRRDGARCRRAPSETGTS